MNVQPIKPYTTNKTSFKARPVGLARTVINQALSNTMESYSNVTVTRAQNALMDIANFGKHFYGENKPIEIKANRSSCGYMDIFEFLYKDKSGKHHKFFETSSNGLYTNPSVFIEKISESLNTSPIANIAKNNDSKIESKLFMERIFGKE